MYVPAYTSIVDHCALLDRGRASGSALKLLSTVYPTVYSTLSLRLHSTVYLTLTPRQLVE